MLEQFKKFLVETNAIALAIGVVVGGAVQKLVSSIVADLIMPLLSLVLPGGHGASSAFRSARDTIR